MQVRKLELSAFMPYTSAEIELPETGVVCVTGPNGAGKSSLLEAVTVAGWGETLRGSPPWQEGTAGSVLLQSDGLVIRRTRGKKTLLEWVRGAEAPVVYETTQKAQAALEHVIGTLDVWRRTCVFSSQEVAHFTQATDGERKRLLEGVLALDRFDAALDACRQDIRLAENAVFLKTQQVSVLQGKLEVEARRVRDAQAAVASVPPSVDTGRLRAQQALYSESIKGIDSEVRSLNAALSVLGQEIGGRSAAVDAAARRLERLSAGKCDRCGQEIPASLVDPLRAEVHDGRRLLTEYMKSATEERAAIQEQVEELIGERQEFTKRSAEINASLMSSAAAQRQYDLLRGQLTASQQSLASLEEEQRDAEKVLAEASAELATLTAVEQVLGLKGVRAHILGQTLSGLEAVANVWLARISKGVTITLKACTEKRSGGVTDAISLEIHGAGGGYGYRAASGGERRRIDVALLLALSEVAQAAHQRGQGSTLWVDEAFDSLDAEGRLSVVAALQELAADRCVVVITHDPALVEAMKPRRHFRVEGGLLQLMETK